MHERATASILLFALLAFGATPAAAETLTISWHDSSGTDPEGGLFREEDSGTQDVDFVVKLSSTPSHDVQIRATAWGKPIDGETALTRYDAAKGGKGAGRDFIGFRDRNVVWEAGATGAALIKTVTVRVLGDEQYESDEYLSLRLNNLRTADSRVQFDGGGTKLEGWVVIGNDDDPGDQGHVIKVGSYNCNPEWLAGRPAGNGTFGCGPWAGNRGAVHPHEGDPSDSRTWVGSRNDMLFWIELDRTPSHKVEIRVTAWGKYGTAKGGKGATATVADPEPPRWLGKDWLQAGVDFLGFRDRNIVWEAGATGLDLIKYVRVDVVPDDVEENDETFTLRLNNLRTEDHRIYFDGGRKRLVIPVTIVDDDDSGDRDALPGQELMPKSQFSHRQFWNTPRKPRIRVRTPSRWTSSILATRFIGAPDGRGRSRSTSRRRSPGPRRGPVSPTSSSSPLPSGAGSAPSGTYRRSAP